MLIDALKMMLAMALFFGAMYLYAWMPEILDARKQKLREKEQLQKLAEREAKLQEQQKLRKERSQSIQERRVKIKEHFQWLEKMNEQISQIKNK